VTYIRKYYSGISTNCKNWIAAFCLFFCVPADNVHGFDAVSFEQGSIQSIPVPSKVDLTKLPRGKIFQVNHSKFTLKFFFNNRDVFGFILKREPNFGIILHLCFFRSCEESPYDSNQIVAMPQDSPSDQTFFSVKFPRGLKYDFQGMEFLPVN